jgi:hypothetical protein
MSASVEARSRGSGGMAASVSSGANPAAKAPRRRTPLNVRSQSGPRLSLDEC